MEEEKGILKEGEEIADLSSLPEGVIAKILSLTSPSDVCRSATVSRIFSTAAESDIVWERFLPSDLDDLVARCESRNLNSDRASSSKKDIFFLLCNRPLIIDDGKKSFALDRRSGKKCIMLGARELSIVWGDTPYYWRWESRRKSRFAEVAVLLNVWWLEIRGKISCRMLCPATTYAAYLVFKMIKRQYYGFNIDPADAMVGIVGGEYRTKSVCLDPYFASRRRRRSPWDGDDVPQNMLGLPLPRKRRDGWFENEMGEFEIGDGDDELEMILKEVEGNSSKSGLIVHGIEIRPKINPA